MKKTHLGLGGGTDTRDRKTDVDSRTDTLEEELGLEEDLAVTAHTPTRVRTHSHEHRKEQERTNVMEMTLVGM
jgi:hypothetical protein